MAGSGERPLSGLRGFFKESQQLLRRNARYDMEKKPFVGKNHVSGKCNSQNFVRMEKQPGNRYVKTPHWESLDPKAYLKVIQNMQQRIYREPEEKWQPISSDMLQRINEGQSRLWDTWIDLDRDGQKEHVVRFDDLPCEKGDGSYPFGLPAQVAVVDDNISKVDVRYDYLHHGFDITVHDDKPYIMARQSGVAVKFDSGRVGFRNSLELQEPFSARGGYEKGMRSVCVFDYIK